MAALDTLFHTLLIFAVILHGRNVRAKIPGVQEVCPHIVSRLAWDGREPRGTMDLPNLPEFVVICHTVTPKCRDHNSCSANVRSMQNYHMDQKHLYDIGYNFMIGENGAVYEGRGWNHVGSQVGNYNNRSMTIAFIGDFRRRVPDPIALKVAKKLIACGVSRGKIPQEYKLVGHRQVSDTISPGEKLFDEIKTWPGWTSNLNEERGRIKYPSGI